MRRIFTLLFVASFFSFSSVEGQISNHVVISQVYGGGGNGSAPYLNDYVELFNPTTADVPLTGYSIQYASGIGTTWNNKINLTGTILAGKYFLVSLASGGSVGVALPTADQMGASSGTGSINMSATAGKVALVNSTTELTGACPTDATIVDFVGYGTTTTTNCSEPQAAPVAPAPAPSNTNAIFRIFGGCVDLNINATDFTTAAPAPRNSSVSNNCAVLPLNLTSFTSSFNGKAAQLSWKTQNEINLKGFSVERSFDGNIYTEVGFVNAKNAANNSYSFTDADVKSGANYYRIKMVDKDGNAKQSSVVVVSNRTGLKASVFPNPVIGNLTVTHSKAGVGSLLRVLTIEGKQLKTFAVQVGALQTSASVSELVKGNYLIVFENNGVKTVTQFSKQ